MKRVRFIFPLMFIIALAGSAFTLHSRSSKKADFLTAYYQDPWMDNCDVAQLSDDKCIPEEAGYICEEYILGIGPVDMFQYGISSICWQPFYSYVQ